jgi:pimeloyl-ACP methyl ester carboxylesterase
MTTSFVVSSDGTRLAVHEYGDPVGPVVVAVHGYPDNHHVWDGLAAELPDHRVIAYDVRGAGQSDAPAGRAGYRNEQLGDDLAAVLDAVSPDAPVHLVGHDWGSMQLWRPLAERRFVGRVSSFTSISGPSLDHAATWLRTHSHRGASLRQMLVSTYMLFFQLPALPEAVLRLAPVERVAGRAFPRSARDKTNGINLYRANVVQSLVRPRPPRLDLPVLVLAPVDDPFARLATVTRAPVPFVRDLTVEEIPGGHWVLAEDPALVARHVRAFTGRRAVGVTRS